MMLKTASYVMRRGSAWLRRRLLPQTPPRQEPDVLPYPAWIARRLQDRREEYPAQETQGLFSLLTPVFDPPSGFFRRLGKSILAQDHADWQWVIVDNGCRNRDVLYLMESFARDARVTLVKSSIPRGIIGGMRLALEHATGRYVCPVDHDDQLYPDALRVVAASLAAHHWPMLAYTDEDKLFPDGTPGLPSFKPDWDPLLFLNAFYIAHLGVMDRRKALELEIYTDPHAEGTPDGDAFCRFVAAGYQPLHIPEIVYSWRMHMQSTALRGVDAKPYVTANQKHVLNGYLQQRGLDAIISLRTNPLPGLAGSWRVQADPEPVSVLVMPGAQRAVRRQLRDRLRLSRNIQSIHWLKNTNLDQLDPLLNEQWLLLLSPKCLPVSTDFVSECQAVLQAVPDSVLAGGILQDSQGKVISAGLAWGMEGFMGSPLKGYPVQDYAVGMGSLCFQHCVSSVDARFCMVQGAFLRDALAHSGCDLTDPLLPAWFAALAREQGKRVVFTPYVMGQIVDAAAPRQIDSAAQFQFLSDYGQWLTHDPWYSRFLGLTSQHAHQTIQPALRRATLQRTLSALADTQPEMQDWLGPKTTYPTWLPARRLQTPSIPPTHGNASARSVA